MRLEPFHYERPGSLAELARLWRADPAGETVYLAGGTDLLVKVRQRLLRPQSVISLTGLPELYGIREDGGTVVIGAATPLEEVARARLVRERFPALAAAAGRVASPQIRNRGTLGGNVCLDTRCLYYNQQEWPGAFPPCFKRGGDRCHVVRRGDRCHALFCADTPAALLVLGAVLRLAGPEGERKVPLEEFYRDDGMHHRGLRPGEVLVSVELPVRAGQVSAYRRFAPRQAVDFPLVGVAASGIPGPGGTAGELRLAATGLVSRPVRLAALEELLREQPFPAGDPGPLIKRGLREIKPLRHQGIGPTYRKQLLAALLEEVLADLGRKGSEEVGKGG